MQFILTDLQGDMSTSEDLADIDSLLTQLDGADAEHADVSISTADGWSISAFRNGNVIYGNIEARPAVSRHIKGATRDAARRLMGLLANGRFDDLDREPWVPGNPRP